MPGKAPLTDLVSLRPQFLRSVHLERDFYARDANGGYLVTRGSLSALELLARGMKDPSCRAQTISGPYGAGKSALAMYFARLLDADNAHSDGFRIKARSQLGEIGKALLPPTRKGYVPVLITGARKSLTLCLTDGLMRSLQRSGNSDLLRRLFTAAELEAPSAIQGTQRVVEVLENLSRLTVQAGALGVIVIIDELGKLLEHAALYPEENDLQLLQEMAEVASRSHEYPLWLVTILHQDFSYYASRLGRRHQREWFKVQQRFYDVPCVLDDTDAFQLTAAALNSSANQKLGANDRIGTVARDCAKLAPRGTESDFQKRCVASYPLHPTSLLLLPALFKRFGQNERSLFSFLSAEEPFSLRDWVQKQEFDESNPAFIRLPQLYDYVVYTLIGGKPSPHYARAWTDMEDAMARLGDASAWEPDLLKSIGLLGLVGDVSGLPASRDVLCLALTSPVCSSSDIDDALRSLERKRLIVFRRFRNGYRLSEGSDIDIEEQLTEAHQALPPQSLALPVARDLCPPSHLVARRHSFRTGTLRSLATVPSTKETLMVCAAEKGDSDGRVIHCLVRNHEEARECAAVAAKIKDSSVIVVIGKENDALAESAREVAALEWVRKHTPTLAGDRVARQELSERRLDAETTFRFEWNKAFEPGRRDFTCYWNGKEHIGLSRRQFLSLLSDACDTAFPYAPVVKNELINQRSLSSAASAGRRSLVEAMICNSDRPGLGITGYPPQRSIYESLLLQSGIHRESPGGMWAFGRPGSRDRGLQKAWDYILESVNGKDLRPKPVAGLLAELTSPPHGVANGVAPILLCAVMLSNSSTIAIYEDGSFVPELSVALMERLMHRPGNFSIVAYGVGGERSAVVDRFSRGFQVASGVLPVVRSLYARIASLPQYTRTTRALTTEAISVREAIQRAKSPERLLFIDLPLALGYEPFEPVSDSKGSEEKVADFFASLNKVLLEFRDCYPRLLEQIKVGVCEVFGITGGSSAWREKASKRASKLRDSVTDPRLRVFIVRAQETALGETEYLESVGAGIAGQTPSRWTQADEDNFRRLVPELAGKWRAIESTLHLNTILEEGEDGYLVAINDRNGEIMRRIIRFTAKERDKIRRLADILTDKVLSRSDSRIRLAALAEAARRLAGNSAGSEGE